MLEILTPVLDVQRPDGGYHVVSLDSDYRWALVVGADLGYAWILARDKTLDTDTRTALLARAKALGVDTDALIWVNHQDVKPNAQ